MTAYAFRFPVREPGNGVQVTVHGPNVTVVYYHPGGDCVTWNQSAVNRAKQCASFDAALRWATNWAEGTFGEASPEFRSLDLEDNDTFDYLYFDRVLAAWDAP